MFNNAVTPSDKAFVLKWETGCPTVLFDIDVTSNGQGTPAVCNPFCKHKFSDNHFCIYISCGHSASYASDILFSPPRPNFPPILQI